MDLTAFLKKYADQVSGQYTEYDNQHSIIIVPVSGGRFQTVMGNIKQNALYNRRLITFISKVCMVKPGIDFQLLLEQTAFFNYCRFTLAEGYIQVEAVAAWDNISEETIKEMIQEVANLADQYEMRLTGADIH